MKKRYHPSALSTRSAPGPAASSQPAGELNTQYCYRSFSLRLDSGSDAPASLEDKTRSVDVVAATENPVEVYDYERWEVVPEVLLMSGCELPASRQIPLLDTHYRGSVESVIGSARGLSIQGADLLGRAYFSSEPEGEKPFTKIREGHLTDFSIGYRVLEAQYVPDGEKQKIGGRMFTGPIKVATRWLPKELSVCPIGADDLAKARADYPAPQNQENDMDPKLRAFLERRGMPKTATDAEAERFLKDLESRMAADVPAGTTTPASPGNTTPVVVDVDKARAEAVGGERNRIVEIDAMCRQFDCPDLANDFIGKGTSLDLARKAVLDHLAEQSKHGGGSIGHRAPAEVGLEERDKFRAAAQDSLLIRAGLAGEKTAAGATDLAGFSLRELARESLRRQNLSANGNPMEMIGRAMVSADFPSLLANVANKSLEAGFAAADETWSVWCNDGSVADFKTLDLVRASETDDLLEVPDHGEYKYGERSDSKEQVQIATYGRLFAITRHTIINDDLNALTDVPKNHGESANRKVGDVAYAVLTANGVMGDGTALFHSDHSNLAGAGAVIGVTSMAGAIAAMKQQKDIAGKRRLNIRPQYLLAPTAIEAACEVFFKSEKFDGTNKAATTANPYAGTAYTRVYEPRLDDSSATAYYLAGAKGKTVTVFFLHGNKTPRLETKAGWTVDGVEYKVSLDVAAKARDWRALYKQPGA